MGISVLTQGKSHGQACHSSHLFSKQIPSKKEEIERKPKLLKYLDISANHNGDLILNKLMSY